MPSTIVLSNPDNLNTIYIQDHKAAGSLPFLGATIKLNMQSLDKDKVYLVVNLPCPRKSRYSVWYSHKLAYLAHPPTCPWCCLSSPTSRAQWIHPMTHVGLYCWMSTSIVCSSIRAFGMTLNKVHSSSMTCMTRCWGNAINLPIFQPPSCISVSCSRI